MPQAASIMAVPDVDLQHLEQLPPEAAEQPVGAASLLPAAMERQEDIVRPADGEAPPLGAAAKDNALPDAAAPQLDKGAPGACAWQRCLDSPRAAELSVAAIARCARHVRPQTQGSCAGAAQLPQEMPSIAASILSEQAERAESHNSPAAGPASSSSHAVQPDRADQAAEPATGPPAAEAAPAEEETLAGKAWQVSDAERRLLHWHWANLEYGCSAALDEVSLAHWNQVPLQCPTCPQPTPAWDCMRSCGLPAVAADVL